jgi:tetratricopeptide (TPR) repeat protein
MRNFIKLALLILLIGVPISTRAADQRDLDLCEEAENLDIAIQACSRILNDTRETGSVRVQVFINRGNIYYTNGDANHAMADFNAAIQLDPKNSMAFNNRGSVYQMKGDGKRAMADYNEAIRLDATNAIAFRNRGVLYLGIADRDHAMADFNEAIRLDPKNAAAFLWRGVLYGSMGNTDSADADWNEAERLDPETADTFFNNMKKMMQQPN